MSGTSQNRSVLVWSEKAVSLVEKYHTNLILFVLLLAFLLRVLALLSLKNTIYYDFLLWDEKIYHSLAVQIASGTFDSKSIYDFSPLFAYIIAAIYKVFSINILYVRLFNILLGVGVCFFVYLLSRNLFSKKIGLVACLFAACYEPLIFFSIVPLKTCLSVFLFSAFCFVLTNCSKTLTFRNVFLLGVLLGLLPSVRGNYFIIWPLICLVLIYSQAKQQVKHIVLYLIILAIGTIFAISPFALRNYFVANEFALTASQAGFNFYIGNNLESNTPYYRPVPFASPVPQLQSIHFAVEASRRTGTKLSMQESSAYWIQYVFSGMTNDPINYAKKFFYKVLASINKYEGGDHYDIDFLSNFVGFFKFPFPNFLVLFPLAMLGVASNRKNTVTGVILVLVGLAYAFTLVAFFTNSRYRLPLVIFLIPYAIVGAQYLFEVIASKNVVRISLALIFSLGCFVLESIPIPGVGDITAYINTHAIILNSKGRRSEAIEYWRLSSDTKDDFSCYADLSLANLYIRKRKFHLASTYLENIQSDSFAKAQKYNLIGDIYKKKGQAKMAIEAYGISLEVNSAQLRTRKKLVRMYKSIESPLAKSERSVLKDIRSFYSIPLR